jgi:hypothetical protein
MFCHIQKGEEPISFPNSFISSLRYEKNKTGKQNDKLIVIFLIISKSTDFYYTKIVRNNLKDLHLLHDYDFLCTKIVSHKIG